MTSSGLELATFWFVAVIKIKVPKANFTYKTKESELATT
jgi:hypothetical protein